MNFTRCCALVPLVPLVFGACAALAADPPPPPNLATLPPLAAASAPGAADRAAPVTASAHAAQGNRGTGVETKVVEDDKVRIEEKRLRGQTQAVTVHSKMRGVADYEVIMPPLGKDPSQDKGAAGKHTWSLFDF